MKISVLLKIARQVEGDYVFVDVIKAHKSGDKLWRHMRENELPRTETIGEVGCVIEYGIIEDIEIEEDPISDE